MTQQQTNISDNMVARWLALLIVAFTMMAAYYVNDVMAPLKGMMESTLGWTSGEFGFFTGAYSFLNVFILMLIWGGLILDRFGIRFTGILATMLMVVGTIVEYYALQGMSNNAGTIMGYRADLFVASAGYAVFGVGAEVAGITTSKIIAKWFVGKELALAMGVQVALARIGSQAAYAVAIPIARQWNLTTPLLIGLAVLVAGMCTFGFFCLMDRRMDRQVATQTSSTEDDDKFSFSDVRMVVSNPGFWLIALLCVLFYSCIFPFQKFATELMITKYGVAEDIAGTFAGLPALGALLLTPVFGGLIDKRGHAASIMILGSAMLIAVHGLYAIPSIHSAWVAIVLMIVLGVAFSLVPSAMWPSVAKIFPVKQLGTAYALIFWIQNIGLWGIPFLIGYTLEQCITDTSVVNGQTINYYDYTLPMCIFTGIACLALGVSVLLRMADKKYHYHLEEKNIKE